MRVPEPKGIVTIVNARLEKPATRDHVRKSGRAGTRTDAYARPVRVNFYQFAANVISQVKHPTLAASSLSKHIFDHHVWRFVMHL